MADIAARLIGIFLLRLGPQDLPASGVVLALVMAAYMILTWVALEMGPADFEVLPVILLSVVMAMGLCWGILRLAGKTARWLQTISALFGAAVVFRLLGLPMAIFGGEGGPGILELLSLALFTWSFVVDGHIYRHALDIALSMGIAVAVVLFAVSYFILYTMVGPL